MKLGAVVVNYGTAGDAISIALDLSHQNGIAEVVVVDNASPDLSAVELKRALGSNPKILLEMLATNVGYGAGNNVGIARLRLNGCTHVLVVNPDVIVTTQCVEELVRSLLIEGWALACPLLLDPSGDIDSAGGFWNYRFGKSRVPTSMALIGDTRRGEVACFSGACFIADIESIERVGGLPERFFLYGEEVDLSVRLGRQNIPWGVTVAAIAHHARGASIGTSTHLRKKSPTSTFYASRSAVLVTRSWWPAWVPVVVASRVAYAFALLARGSWRASFAALRGTLAGCFNSPQRAARSREGW